MDWRVLVALILSATTIIVRIVISLTWIAETHDGNTESIVVSALVGLPIVIITSAAPMISHYMGVQSQKAGDSSVPQSNP